MASSTFAPELFFAHRLAAPAPRMPVRVWAWAPRMAHTQVRILSFNLPTTGRVKPSDLLSMKDFQALSAPAASCLM